MAQNERNNSENNAISMNRGEPEWKNANCMVTDYFSFLLFFSRLFVIWMRCVDGIYREKSVMPSRDSGFSITI